jgi:Ca-activated chloride channel family protein
MIKQIILITDGCSNEGISPVVASAHAAEENIVVNVVGIVDEGQLGKHGSVEIEQIAKAGGGMSRITSSQLLSQTVQMMTRKTVAHTIQQAVNKELREIMGETAAVSSLPPHKREKVVQVIDDLGETASLRVALLIDSSSSMRPKLRAVEEAIRDLMLSLQSREGTSEICVFHFPGDGRLDSEIVMDVNWTRDLASVNSLFRRLNMKGTTPTGPAILELVRFFAAHGGDNNRPTEAFIERLGSAETAAPVQKEGLLGEYVV